MLLLDEIVEQSEQAIHCRKQFRADEFFVQGHYPGQPIVPGVILCECAAQASAVLLSALVEGLNMLARRSRKRSKQGAGH